MTCPRCRRDFNDARPRCPQCGEKNRQSSGVFQTSTVLISAEGADSVYRSVDDVPAKLRSRLLKSTSGTNSATILIADRKGRQEIEKAMRKLPGPAQGRLVHSILEAATVDPLAWLTPQRRKWVAAVVVLLALALVAAAFLYRGK